MEARELRRMSVDEYISFDRSSEEKWEYADGEAFAMAGGSTAHALVAKNLIVALSAALDGMPCLAFHEAQKIATVRTRAYHYPDASVVCPPFTKDERDEHALTSPVALFEVLSPSTEDYDRGRKFLHYRSSEALRNYVLIDPESREVEHRKRVAVDQWLSTFYVGDGEVTLASVDVSLTIALFWKDLDRLIAR